MSRQGNCSGWTSGSQTGVQEELIKPMIGEQPESILIQQAQLSCKIDAQDTRCLIETIFSVTWLTAENGCMVNNG